MQIPKQVRMMRLLRLGCAVWVGVFLWSTGAQVHAENLQTLKRELTQTNQESERLQKQLTDIKKGIQGMTMALFIPLQISHRLGRAESILKFTQETLSPLRVLPQIGSIVGGVLGALDVFQKGISPIRRETVQMEKPLMSVGNALMVFDRELNQAHQATKQTLLSLQKFSKTATALENCIRKTKGARGNGTSTEAFARSGATQVQVLQKTLQGVNRALDPVSGVLRKSHALVAAMAPVQKALGQVDKVLGQVESVVKEIQRVLQKRISVPYPVKIRQPFKVEIKDKVKVKVRVKIKKWYNPFSWKWVFKTQVKWKEIVKVETKWKDVVQTKEFGFTVLQILKGINTGTSVVNGKLQTLAMKAIDPVLQKLKDRLPKLPTISSIGGLAGVSGSMKKLVQETISAPTLLKTAKSQWTGLNSKEKTMQLLWSKRPKCR